MKTSFFLGLIAAVFLPVAQYGIWQYAPQELVMGEVQRIFYMHLPLAWWALLAFFLVFVLSIRVLLRPRHHLDILALSFAEIGVLFTSLTLITGSIWARAAWNTWWTWDPRLTTALIMWFIYVAYLVLRRAGFGGEKQMRVSAVLGVIAFLDVPLVFFSARFWRSIHPAVFSTQGTGLDQRMLLTLCVSILAVGCLFLALVLVRWKQLLLAAGVERMFGDIVSRSCDDE